MYELRAIILTGGGWSRLQRKTPSRTDAKYSNANQSKRTQQYVDSTKQAVVLLFGHAVAFAGCLF
jgi:hypothetical protein